jgi:hypothetical protein
MRRRSRALAVVLTLGLVALVACGNGANSVGVCQELESVRCAEAPKCGVDLTWPLHEGSSTSDNIQACQLYYQDACLHGLVTPNAPSGVQVTACVTAIKGSCTVMLAPQSSPACSFLIPPNTPVDAGHDAGVTDAATTPDVIIVVVTPDTGVDAGDASTCDPSCEATCVDNAACITACGC